MGKFKNWLIHKLGGYTKEDFKIPLPKLISRTKSREIKKIVARTELYHSDEEMNQREDEIKNNLKDHIFELLKSEYPPKVTFYSDEDGHGVEMVFEYLEPEKENFEEAE